MIANKVLNEEFAKNLRDLEQNKTLWQMIGQSDATSEALDGQAWQQTIGQVAKMGVPNEFETANKFLEPLEKVVRETLAIPSERPGGKRSLGTGYALHPTFKSYKSTIKGAIENGVELLDAIGVPRSRGDVSNDIKLAKQVDKSDEEKLGSATDTWLAIYAKCADTDPLTIDAVNKMLNALKGRGAY
jgi:hypothetical protein